MSYTDLNTWQVTKVNVAEMLWFWWNFLHFIVKIAFSAASNENVVKMTSPFQCNNPTIAEEVTRREANYSSKHFPDSNVHGDNMGPTRVLSPSDGPHAAPMNLAIRVSIWHIDTIVFSKTRRENSRWDFVKPNLTSWSISKEREVKEEECGLE